MVLQRLKEAAEKAKHELSSSQQTEINLPLLPQMQQVQAFEYKFISIKIRGIM